MTTRCVAWLSIAEQRFGSSARMHDIAYDVRGGGWAETLWQDIRYGARGLVAQKVFSATIILTVGIGVGANATIFTLVDRLLLRTLPVERPAELEQLTSTALAAAIIPALRASRIDPTEALRCE